jgi:hypothetical protein
MTRVALATCRVLPDPDPDQGPLVAALRERDLQVELAVWNDTSVDWESFDLVVVRSTWDYTTSPERFVAWVEEVDVLAPVLNPPAIIIDNHHKRYLLDLAARGLAITPTELVGRDEDGDLVAIMERRGWSDVVVKPAISAGSRETLRVHGSSVAEGQTHLSALLENEDVLIQEYQRSVEDYGERALVWIDGGFTHAIRKTTRWGGDEENVSKALPIADDERAFGEAALAPYADDLLYARVDLARGPDGAPRLMELELIEPSLFLVQGGPAILARFADAIANKAAE